MCIRDSFGSLGEILRNLGGNRSVTLMARRFPRSEVPNDKDAQISWLFDRWQELDDWVELQHRSGRALGSVDSAFKSEIT